MDSLNHADPSKSDPCAHDFPRSPCVGGTAGIAPYPATVRTYNDSAGKPVIQYWLIHGLSHNYSGGSYGGNFTDPYGPDITTAAWSFFAAHPLR